jgi:glycosyltransferase involved in cell wall biosynthesis
LSAGAFRATTLVDALVDALPPQSTIDVVTTRPNRYSTFSPDAPPHESLGRVNIHRIELPPHRSGMRDQSTAFLHYARAVRKRIAAHSYNLVFATSSRLMTATLGAYVARQTRAPLYLDIRDIFADTIVEVIGPPTSWFLRPMMSGLERWTVRAARKVNLVSHGFAPYFERRYPGRTFSYFTNGVDDEFVDRSPTSRAADWRRPPTQRDDRITILYAGNVGDGQGLHHIVPGLARRLAQRARFQIVGGGGRRTHLERALSEAGVTNVELLEPVPRNQLQALYAHADVLFLHLNDYSAFRKVLPSKLFEYAALGKPIWAGVAGYAKEFIRTEIENAAVFEPGDVDGALQAFADLELRDVPRRAFIEKFARRSINLRFAADIVSIAEVKR